MAESITVRRGDTLTAILQNKRGIQFHDLPQWQAKTRQINPHIANLDKIYPGDTLLIPQVLQEQVLEDQIWRNAFFNLPKSFGYLSQESRDIYFGQPGQAIDDVIKYMFSGGHFHAVSPNTKRALLIYNNPYF